MNSHNVEYLESQAVDQARAASHLLRERLTKSSIRMTMFIFLILKNKFLIPFLLHQGGTLYWMIPSRPASQTILPSPSFA